MILTVHLYCKFRAFFITFGTVEKSWSLPVPDIALLFAQELTEKVRYDDRGVKLSVTLNRL